MRCAVRRSAKRCGTGGILCTRHLRAPGWSRCGLLSKL